MNSTRPIRMALTLLLTLPLGVALSASPAAAQYNGPRGGQNVQQQGGWDAPPTEFADEIQRRGFRDGIAAARADYTSRVQPNPEGHEEFRHPHVPYPARDTYREAYKRGYYTASKHIQEHQQERGNDQPVPEPGYRPQQGGWDAPPSEYAGDLQRHAFHDGIEAARADVANRVQPNPESHEEFRHPHVEYAERDSYREAYKRGYFMAVRHMQEQGR